MAVFDAIKNGIARVRDPFKQFHGVGFEQSSLAELAPLGVSSVVTNNVAHVPLIERTRSQRQVLLIQYASVLYVCNRLHAMPDSSKCDFRKAERTSTFVLKPESA
jgi:hypothetical protein